jgi:hypothetical protein
MHPSPIPLWDAYFALRITTRDSREMFCTGYTTTHGNSRCRLKITGEYFDNVLDILNEMSMLPLDGTCNQLFSSLLHRLARTSLCLDYHRRQEADRVEEWRVFINKTAKSYQIIERLKLEKIGSDKRCKEEVVHAENLNEELKKEKGKVKTMGRKLNLLHEQSLRSKDEIELQLAKEMMKNEKISQRVTDLDGLLLAERDHSHRLESDRRGYEIKNSTLQQTLDDFVLKHHQELENVKAAAAQTEGMQNAVLERQSEQLQAVKQKLAIQADDTTHLERNLNAAQAREVTLAKKADEALADLEARKRELKESGRTVEELRVMVAEMDVVRKKLAIQTDEFRLLQNALEETTVKETALSSKIEEVVGDLEATKRELEKGGKTIEELQIASAAMVKTYSEERAEKQNLIAQLEKKLSSSLLQTLSGWISAMVQRLALWSKYRKDGKDECTAAGG